MLTYEVETICVDPERGYFAATCKGVWGFGNSQQEAITEVLKVGGWLSVREIEHPSSF